MPGKDNKGKISFYHLKSCDTVKAINNKAEIQKELKLVNYYRKQQKKWAEAVKHHKATDDDCVFVKKHSVAERLKHYPFYKAAKIYAVSYDCCERNADVVAIDDTVSHKKSDTIFEAGLNIKNGKLNYTSLKEIKRLKNGQINQLTNIIFNTKSRKPSLIADPGHACFNPRNAIIFYDQNGKIFDYLEVCFECTRYYSLSEKMTIGTYCAQKYELLRKIFLDLGIKYGTIDQ